MDDKAAMELATNAAKALDEQNFPAACVLLDVHRSEIRAHTHHIPLATYPDALKQAARLLDQKKNYEAKNVVLSAINILVAVDRVTPIPLLLARAAINRAQTDTGH